jgi:hypothetical protein
VLNVREATADRGVLRILPWTLMALKEGENADIEFTPLLDGVSMAGPTYCNSHKRIEDFSVDLGPAFE